MSTAHDVIQGDARWCVLLGDNADILPTLADRSVAHVITDPPYSDDLYSRTRTNKGSGLRPNGKPVYAGEGGDNTSALVLASRRIGSIDDTLDQVAGHFLRLARQWIIAFHDCEIGDKWRKAFGDCYVRTGAWVKTDPMPQISGDRPAAGFEPCTIAHNRGRKRWNGGGLPAVWAHGTSKGSERPDHPCPKPLALMLDMVEQFTDVDDVVLDPYCGSGTTGIACLMLGRRFIGIERDEEFARLSIDRLDGVGKRGQTEKEKRTGQTTLFDEAAP